MAAAQGPVATYPSKRRQCSGWTEPRAAGTSPGAQHTPELCWEIWPRCRAPRHAHTAVAWRKSLGDGQNSSGPVLCGFVPYAEVMAILLSSVHVLSARGVTKEQWGTLMGLQRLQSSIPCSSSWFPNSPQTLGRSGDRSELCNQRHWEGVKGDRSKLCNQKLLWDMPLQHRELLPLGKEIQVPVQHSPTLHPGHLHSIPPPAHPGTQEVPECRTLALAVRAGDLHQHTQPCTASHMDPSSTELPHTPICASLSKSLLEVNIYIYCKWLIGNKGLRAPLG